MRIFSGLNGLDEVFLTIGWSAIVLCLIVITISFFSRNLFLRILLGILSAGLAALCVLYFQPEAELYWTASVMALIVVIGFYKVFK